MGRSCRYGVWLTVSRRKARDSLWTGRWDRYWSGAFGVGLFADRVGSVYFFRSKGFF